MGSGDGATSVATGLTPDKKLAQGTYAGVPTQTVLRTITAPTLTFPGQTTPAKLKPGTTSVPFTLSCVRPFREPE